MRTLPWAALFALVVNPIAIPAHGLGVAVSVPPQAYFAERIGGDRVEVTVMIPPGASPEVFEPTAAELSRLARAKAYVAVGHPNFPFEKTWLRRTLSANPGLTMIDSSIGLETMADDPHIWLSARAVRVQAVNICRGFSGIDPENSEFYERNLKEFLVDLKALDRELGELFAERAGRSFLVYHPAWGYLARDYGLNQMVIEEQGHEPNPAGLARTIAAARAAGVRAVIVQPQSNRRNAEVVARELGCRTMVLDPLARDWLANLRRAARELASILEAGASSGSDG